MNASVNSSAEEVGELPQRDLTGEVLRIAEVLVASTREVVDKALCRMQLRLHEWQTMHDPEARSWLDGARRSVKDGTAAARASTRADILQTIEQASSQR